MKERFVPVKTAAELLDVDEQTMRRWCREGKVEAFRTPGGYTWRVVVRDGRVVLA